MKKLNLVFLLLCLSISFRSLATGTLSTPIGSTYVFCQGTTGVLTDATTGGTWSTSDPAVATIGLTSGDVYGVAAGTATITYIVGGLYQDTTITIHAAPVFPTGPSTICTGSTTTYTDGTSGGVWYTYTGTLSVNSASGAVTGISTGEGIVVYGIPGLSACAIYDTIMVVSGPAPITGITTICGGGTTTLSDVTGGVTWSTSSAMVATIGATTGVVTGVTAGTVIITCGGSSGCYTTTTVTVGAMPVDDSVIGGGAYCAGGSGESIGILSTTSGVSYQLYLGGTAVGSAVVGTGAGISFGTFTTAGTYSVLATGVGGCVRALTGTATITINPLPAVYAVTGGGTYCAGGSGEFIGVGGTDLGIDYQLEVVGSLVGSPVSGTGSSVSFGLHTAAGVYTVLATNATTGCSSDMTGSATIVINPAVTPAVSISAAPGTVVCTGTSVTFTADPVNGGSTPTYAWTVNGTAVGSGNTYTYTPVSGDIVAVTMTSDAPCATPTTASNSVTMTVLSSAVVTATATTASCGGGVTLSASGAGTYSWSPTTGLSCPTCASTYDSANATVTYVVTGSLGGSCASGTATVTVNGNRIYGNITFSGAAPDTLNTKVWLIQFNSSDSSLIAADSTTTCLNGGTPYYEFDGEPSGDYFVKAQLLYGNPAGASGYIPTYGASSAFWFSASDIAHASGGNNMNIEMIYGTVPSGPGFIGGLISEGAGRGTSTLIPAVGMLVYLRDGSTNHILTHTYTDNTGAYSFSGLAAGNYIVYPENFDEYTIPSSLVTLTTAVANVTNVDFVDHTNSRLITPYSATAVKTVTSTEGLNVYPNPTTGALNIQWANQSIGNANVVVTDVLGRVVNNSILNINAVSGQSKLDLSNLKAGIYTLSIKSDNICYTSKLQLEN